MSDSMAISSGGEGDVFAVAFQRDHSHAPVVDAIRAEVHEDGVLVLRPMNALGAIYLSQFGHGGLRPTWTYRHDADGVKPYAALRSVRVETDTGPLLSTGGDPYHSGMSLSAAERDACRALVEEMRNGPARCSAETREGRRCKNTAQEDGLCGVHREPSR